MRRFSPGGRAASGEGERDPKGLLERAHAKRLQAGDIVGQQWLREVFFTGFTPQASPVVLNVELDQLGNVQGAVRVRSRVLATIQGHFDPRTSLVSWQGACDARTAPKAGRSLTAPSGVP